MANMKKEKYGIVSSDGEAAFLRKMGVDNRNIYFIGNCNELLQRVSVGDVLCICDVKSFSIGAYDLYNKMQYFSNRGVELQIMNEKILCFSRAKPMQQAVEQALRNVAYREHEFVLWIHNSRLNQETKAQLISRVRYEFLTDVVLMFHNNGVKRRAN